ncbi:K+/H+ antiporter subunit F [Rhodobacter capsulatus]|uniref:K+/H+ antiporter subunit F n=1 Tax=Rhodobacter capsulatus TaxID=1061 RepID=UPI0006DCBFB2|nr:K+/H+ antiporter subunit F [Rhodobacter capsulatus]KQB13954.1 cation:proton antiporter [Rhodobacter capsulatus]KQB14384.1 cation:proton antiporter [Rhodobacter capsulatus]PZX23339.1 multicomponent K+:H+ antiporter subunit F [Rhodobacter capsulatus]QNR64814.1 K+/H+ antiporter subunit F [Rhodobacter capsulatus]
MTTLLWFALSYAQIALALAACLAALRILLGPRAQDRVLALEALYVATMLLFIVTGMRMGTPFLFEAALVIAVAGFVSTVSAAKFLLRGEVIE